MSGSQSQIRYSVREHTIGPLAQREAVNQTGLGATNKHTTATETLDAERQNDRQDNNRGCSLSDQNNSKDCVTAIASPEMLMLRRTSPHEMELDNSKDLAKKGRNHHLCLPLSTKLGGVEGNKSRRGTINKAKETSKRANE